MERLHLLVSNHHLFALETLALQMGVTMSWVVRALYFRHRQLAFDAAPRRAKMFSTKHSSFALVLHGDRQSIIDEIHDHRLECGAVFRYLLELYFSGAITVDLGDVRLVKQKKPKDIVEMHTEPINDGFTYVKLISGLYFQPKDYWPINHYGNIHLMKRGLNRRQKPR